ncbi:MAG: hypothetical protein IT282_11755 [Bacteroidetes bacterium]|nr:hypothetical protein [Bacteroidota bacterium]
MPIVHITDLYHPPQDPDDHIDLATIAGLREFDLRGVVLDVTQKFLDAAPAGFDIARDPGYLPVVQLASILGKAIPVACGPRNPLVSPTDSAADRSSAEQGGIRLLLNTLEECQEPVVISVVGSARVVTAAFNRNPALVHAKTRSVLLNAGSTAGTKREWNVGLDLAAYVGLWNSGLPISWYPCATEQSAFNPDHERGTFWKTTHAVLFGNLKPPLRAWFRFAFGRDQRGDFIRALGDKGTPEAWDGILKESRNMWATASLVMAAGRALARTRQGWRFVPATSTKGNDVWPWRLDPIDASSDAAGIVSWEVAAERRRTRIFWRQRGVDFGGAMGEALGALLADIGV